MNIYLCRDYKQILKLFIQQNAGQRGYKSRLAEACRISNSYLSQVLSSHVDLTLDQMHLLTQYWDMVEGEQDYTLTLFNFNKAATPELKKFFEKKLLVLRETNKDLARTIKKKGAQDVKRTEDLLAYYSSWLVPTIHIITSIKEFQTVESISSHLNLERETVKTIIQQLVKSNYLINRNGRYEIKDVNVHTLTPEISSMVNHKNWRQRTIQKLDQLNLEDIHYSGVHSLSVEDFSRLKDDLIDVLGKYRQRMIDSEPAEVLVHLGLDFYQL